MTLIRNKLEQLFQHYLIAFEQQNLTKAQQCYQLPCTLHTPDQVVLVANNADFEKAFLAIFSLLNQANVKRFTALSASFSELDNNIVLACVDWQFLDENNEVFTDFCAFYHLSFSKGQWRIFNVVSQELSQSVSLANPFKILNNITE